MVDRITMNKGVALGYGNLDDLELVGRAFGYDIYVETVESTAIVVWVYDRNVTKRMRRGNWLDDCPNTMETRYRIPAKVCLSKERGAWHVDLLSVDSRYKGNNLAIKIYKFLMKKDGHHTHGRNQPVCWWTVCLEQTVQDTRRCGLCQEVALFQGN
jgi:hypothetical protein